MPSNPKDTADQLLERLEAEYAKLSDDERAACACLIDDIAAAYGMLIGARRLTDEHFSDGLYAVFSLAPALREDAAQLQSESYVETLRPVFESCTDEDHPIADVLFEARKKIVRILIDMVDPDLPDKGELRDVLNQAMRLLPRPEDFLSPFNRILAAFNNFRGIPHPMRSVGWGWIAGRASARQFLPLNIPLYRLYRASVSDRNSTIAIGPEAISPKKWSNAFCMFLANGSTGRRFDAVDKIGNRIARRNGNQEVDVISLSGKIENPNLKSIQDAV